MRQTLIQDNIDHGEIARFDLQAARWWDPKGPLRALHDINPLRLGYVRRHTVLKDKRILDVGCGGGLLAEALAKSGGTVTGIDLSEAALEAARAHSKQSGVQITYRRISSEALANERTGTFDIVTCMELLEHVPDPAAIVSDCHALVRPGGHIFFSTINRNAAAYVLAIVAAEYILGIVEKKTHTYQKFIRPHELSAWARSAGLKQTDLSGFIYFPFIGKSFITKQTPVNYLMHCTK